MALTVSDIPCLILENFDPQQLAEDDDRRGDQGISGGVVREGEEHPHDVQEGTCRTGEGHFQDQADAKWIVIMGPTRGRKYMTCGRPTPGWPISRSGTGRPQGAFVFFSYY
jgi:hypothetical protein